MSDREGHCMGGREYGDTLCFLPSWSNDCVTCEGAWEFDIAYLISIVFVLIICCSMLLSSYLFRSALAS